MPRSQRKRELRFEASARLQRLLGRELLPDEFSAVEELVKNAYDSNATTVRILITRSGPKDSVIEIRDNGEGLSTADFRRLWMWAGYSEKTPSPLPKTGRVPAGEKGIGRFAADKLGDILTVVTKPHGTKKALRAVFDWRRFTNKRKRLSDIRIPYEEVSSPDFSEAESGTILRIQRLRQEWSPKRIQELRQRLSRLLNPYDASSNFKITLEAPEASLSGEIIPAEITGHDFEWEVVRDRDGPVLIERRVKAEPNGALVKWKASKNSVEDPISTDAEFGPIRARFFYFVEKPKKSTVGRLVPGVSVYRDGLRVEPAGSSSADWLGLLEKRAKRAGHMVLVPSRLFGFVEIRRADNPSLQDATNRRAFIRGASFDAFTDFLKRRLNDFTQQIEKEVSEPRWRRSRQKQSRDVAQARVQLLSVLSLGLAHELRQPLQAMQTASENIRDMLVRSGSTPAPVSNAVAIIQRSIDRINKHIVFLRQIGSGETETEQIDLTELIRSVVEFFHEQAAAKNIVISSKIPPALNVEFNRPTLLNTLTNLVLNSQQAIAERGDQKPYRVIISANVTTDSTRIAVEDDGPGILETARPRLLKRPTTSKQGGMGVALIMWKNALAVYGADLVCTSFASPTRFEIVISKEGGKWQEF